MKRPDLMIRFSPDADGLYKMIAYVLNRRHVRKVTLKDSDTASRLGITPAELATLQARLNSDDMMTCHTGPTRTTYRFAPDENTTRTEAEHA